MALVQFLVAPHFDGPFVGAPSKIQTNIYGAWPVVHKTNGQNINNDALDRHRAPFPLTGKEAMES